MTTKIDIDAEYARLAALDKARTHGVIIGKVNDTTFSADTGLLSEILERETSAAVATSNFFANAPAMMSLLRLLMQERAKMVTVVKNAHNKAYILYHTPKAVSRQCRTDVEKLWNGLDDCVTKMKGKGDDQ